MEIKTNEQEALILGILNLRKSAQYYKDKDNNGKDINYSLNPYEWSFNIRRRLVHLYGLHQSTFDYTLPCDDYDRLYDVIMEDLLNADDTPAEGCPQLGYHTMYNRRFGALDQVFRSHLEQFHEEFIRDFSEIIVSDTDMLKTFKKYAKGSQLETRSFLEGKSVFASTYMNGDGSITIPSFARLKEMPETDITKYQYIIKLNKIPKLTKPLLKKFIDVAIYRKAAIDITDFLGFNAHKIEEVIKLYKKEPYFDNIVDMLICTYVLNDLFLGNGLSSSIQNYLYDVRENGLPTQFIKRCKERFPAIYKEIKHILIQDQDNLKKVYAKAGTSWRDLRDDIEAESYANFGLGVAVDTYSKADIAARDESKKGTPEYYVFSPVTTAPSTYSSTVITIAEDILAELSEVFEIPEPVYNMTIFKSIAPSGSACNVSYLLPNDNNKIEPVNNITYKDYVKGNLSRNGRTCLTHDNCPIIELYGNYIKVKNKITDILD